VCYLQGRPLAYLSHGARRTLVAAATVVLHEEVVAARGRLDRSP